MNKSSSNRLRTLMSYLTPPHQCSYLPAQQATNQFISPELPIDTGLYTHLIKLGFRRSGDYVYRPRCFGCDACIPVRIPAARFRANRSQRRNWQINCGIAAHRRPAEFNEEHFDLYRRYLAWRHGGGGMDNPAPRDYMGFLTSRWINTQFYELREGATLVGVSVIDVLVDSLSAVYSFYEPAYSQRGIGVFSILWQINEARRLGLPWVYLGYWIQDCAKMKYKGGYRPLEAYRNGRWVPINDPHRPAA